MSDDQTHSVGPDPKLLGGQVDAVCDRFDALWQAGNTPRVEDFLDCVPEAARRDLLRELIALEVEYRLKAQERPDPE